jgi:hypothetical protein
LNLSFFFDNAGTRVNPSKKSDTVQASWNLPADWEWQGCKTTPGRSRSSPLAEAR